MTVRFRSRNIADLASSVVIAISCCAPAFAQAPPASPAPRPAAAAPAKPAAAPAETAPLPPGYVIGPEDVLSVVYWKDKDMSADVAVRPDGKISLPLLNDIQAAGLTPAALRDRLTEESKRYLEDPNVTVVVKQINSRKVFVVGEVGKPGPYALATPTTVLQLLATVGGLRDYADSKKIVIIRNEGGKQTRFRFNYKDVTAGKDLRQNIELMPGDTVIVP
jgi:polysaccharide biosynthesis/export protein